jgi:tetratricopeptide (TPR) repeat protein
MFVEWLVYFGCFVAAGLIAASKPSFGYTDWTPYYPIPMSLKLMLIFIGSALFAAINAGFPRLRWLVILGGCSLVGCGISWIYRHSTWDYGRNAPWLDSPNDWSVLFGIIFLNIYVVLAVYATLLFAGLHYYAKWNSKPICFSLPKKAAIVYGILGALLLCAAPWFYSSFRVSYWSDRAIYAKDDTKKIELCNEVMRLEQNASSDNYQTALQRRAGIYADQKQYDLALADYNTLDYDIAVRHNGIGVYSRRGNVKFLLGDLPGAIEDYTKAAPADARSRDASTLYNRGFAYEKLGEIEKAIADYTAAIEVERVKEYAPPGQKHFDPAVSRTGTDSPRQLSLEELIEIRNRLEQETSELP